MTYAHLPGQPQPDVPVTTGQNQAVAGCAVGFLVLDLRYPLFPGNVANASTWKFPVLYEILDGVGKEILQVDPNLLNKIIAGGKSLVSQGARAVVGACGYFANYQKDVAAALPVPTFLSSLLQAPLILQSLQSHQKLGILCAFGDSLTPYLFEQVGIQDTDRIIVAGAQNLPEFKKLINSTGTFNGHAMEEALVGHAREMVAEHPEIGALLLECSDMPPYAHAIQNAVRRPVFDYTTMVDWIYGSVVRRPFDGFI